MKKGSVYLIPSSLSNNTEKNTITKGILSAITDINIFFVENIRSARRFIKHVNQNKDIDNIIFYFYGKRNTINLEKDLLPHIIDGKNIGVISEAGAPCIADPGSKIVEYAQELNIKVIPLVGPSSILLALMASGMNGQNFAFLGYLPIKDVDLKKKIKAIEYHSKKNNQTQIFIETPYRNERMIKTIIKNCHSNTRLCIATNISLKSESICTMKIAQWREAIPDIRKKPTVFILNSYKQ